MLRDKKSLDEHKVLRSPPDTEPIEETQVGGASSALAEFKTVELKNKLVNIEKEFKRFDNLNLVVFICFKIWNKKIYMI